MHDYANAACELKQWLAGLTPNRRTILASGNKPVYARNNLLPGGNPNCVLSRRELHDATDSLLLPFVDQTGQSHNYIILVEQSDKSWCASAYRMRQLRDGRKMCWLRCHRRPHPDAVGFAAKSVSVLSGYFAKKR